MNGISNPAIQAAFGHLNFAASNSPTVSPKGEDFGQMLMSAVKDVNSAQNQVGQVQNDFISGRRPVELHDLMITMEKASIGMQLTTAVRNKVLDAYAEIERMQV